MLKSLIVGGLMILCSSAKATRTILLFGFLTWSLYAQVPLDPYLAGLPTVQRITEAPVFANPIVYIGHQAPDPKESEDLWAAIDIMFRNGPGVGIPALELFIETHT